MKDKASNIMWIAVGIIILFMFVKPYVAPIEHEEKPASISATIIDSRQEPEQNSSNLIPFLYGVLTSSIVWIIILFLQHGSSLIKEYRMIKGRSNNKR